MKLADVQVSWMPSVSDDVVSVEFVLTNMVGEYLVREVLLPEVSDFVVYRLKEKSKYLASVTVTDGYNNVSSVLEIVIPDLSAPIGVTDMGYSIINVYSQSEPEPDPRPDGATGAA